MLDRAAAWSLRGGLASALPVSLPTASLYIETGAIGVRLHDLRQARAVNNKLDEDVRILHADNARLESMLADRRELYNEQVYRHNTRIQQLPGLLLAGIFGWRARPFFEAPSEVAAVPPVQPLS